MVVATTWIDAWREVGISGPEDETARISVRSLGNDVDVEIVTSACRYRLRSKSMAGPGSEEIAVHLDGPLSEATTDRIRMGKSGTDPAAETAHGGDGGLGLPASRPSPWAATRDYDRASFGVGVPGSERKRRVQLTTQDNPVAAEAVTERISILGAGRKANATNQETRATSPATDPRDLPQLFTPMAEFGAGPSLSAGAGRDRGAIVSWAVETVWRQVPSRLVLGLMILGRDVTVTHARGEGARCLQGARGQLDEWPAAVVLRAPSRMRFGSDSITLWFRNADGTRQSVEVQSAIWAPLDAEKDAGRDGASPMRTVVMAIDAPRATGFTEGEMSAFGYLAQIVAARLT